jgi:hypothetical protein
MLKLIAVGFALTVASAAQALPPVTSLQHPDPLVTPARQTCGAGMHMVRTRRDLLTTSVVRSDAQAARDD